MDGKAYLTPKTDWGASANTLIMTMIQDYGKPWTNTFDDREAVQHFLQTGKKEFLGNWGHADQLFAELAKKRGINVPNYS